MNSKSLLFVYSNVFSVTIYFVMLCKKRKWIYDTWGNIAIESYTQMFTKNSFLHITIGFLGSFVSGDISYVRFVFS